MKDKNVSFRMIRGRIVPIKTNKAKLPKKIKVKKLKDYTIEKAIGVAGTGLGGFGYASIKLGEHLVIQSSRLRKKSQQAFRLAKAHKFKPGSAHLKRGERLIVQSMELRKKSEKLFKQAKAVGSWSAKARKYGRWIIKAKGIKF